MPNLIDVNTINPFLKSATSVIETVCAISSKIDKPKLKDTSFTDDSVLILLGVTGQLEGQVILEFSEQNAKTLASKMMMGYEVPNLDDMAMSAISELGNMIMGNAATIFSNQNTLIDITPPTVARGNVTLSRQYAANLCVPLICTDGSLLMNLNIAIRGK